MFEHFLVGNLIGHLVLYDEGDAEVVRRMSESSPTGIGEAVLLVYLEDNFDVDEEDIELGSDFSFWTLDEGDRSDVFDDDAILIPLTHEDGAYLLANMPERFLDEVFSESDAEDTTS